MSRCHTISRREVKSNSTKTLGWLPRTAGPRQRSPLIADGCWLVWSFGLDGFLSKGSPVHVDGDWSYSNSVLIHTATHRSHALSERFSWTWTETLPRPWLISKSISHKARLLHQSMGLWKKNKVSAKHYFLFKFFNQIPGIRSELEFRRPRYHFFKGKIIVCIRKRSLKKESIKIRDFVVFF